MRLRFIIIALLIAFWPMQSSGFCTDGVNCLCDTAPMQDASVIWCEDFDDLSWDDGTGVAWDAAPGYSNESSGWCPDNAGGTSGPSDEGTDNDDCYNFVQDNNCDSPDSDCAFGNQALGEKFDTGYGRGIMARYSFGGTYPNIGFTNIIKYSSNFTRTQTTGIKPDEFEDSTYSQMGGHRGHDGSAMWDCQDGEAGEGYKVLDAGGTNRLAGGGASGSDIDNWETRLFHNMGGHTCASDAAWAAATITKGKACCTNADVVEFSAYGSDFEGGAYDWPEGEWSCLRTQYINAGAPNTTIRQWWRGEGDTTDTLVFEVTGLDTSNLDIVGGFELMAFNNYYNGGTGLGSGYCTESDGSDISPPCDRAYRYEDNFVLTNGVPVTCTAAGFPAAGPTGTPTVSPTVSPTGTPTGTPTISPTTGPTGTPTVSPTISPTGTPTGTPTISPTVTPTSEPGEGAVTLDDDFESAHAWSPRSGPSLTCSWDPSGELAFNAYQGVCHYASDVGDGATDPPGFQPSTDDQWGVFEFGSVPSQHTGIALRLKAGNGDPGSSTFNYALRCSDREITIRNCQSDATCETIAAGSTCDYEEGDRMGFMVALTGQDTELCGYYWDSLDDAPSNWDNPGTWGDADFCVSEDAAITALAGFTGGGTVFQDWHIWDPPTATGPDDLYGFPLASQTDVAMYNGWNVAWTAEWMAAGDLQVGASPTPTASPTVTPTPDDSTGVLAWRSSE